MKYCCVPFCKSRYGGSIKISFFEFPSAADIRAAWINAISKEGEKKGSVWKPSDYTVVCEKHFTDDDFSKSTKRKRLLPGVIPSIFPGYPSYKLPKSSQKRKPPISRLVENTVLKKRCLENNSETCIPINLPEEPIQASSFECNVAVQKKKGKITTKLHNRLRSLRRVNSTLLNRIKKLKNKISALKSEKNKESNEEKQLKKIIKEKSENKMSAIMLMEQIRNYGKKKVTLNTTALKFYILWQKRSPRGYDFVRNMGIFNLPHKGTLKKYLGYSTGETGITSLIKLRLHHEFKNLTHEEEKFGSLIIDEMAIKAKLMYDRKLDMFVGSCDTEIERIGISDRLANNLLCFLFKGLSTDYQIPVAYFFTNQLTGNELHKLTIAVIENVEKAGFKILRISTDNCKVNVVLFNLLSGGSAKHKIQHPNDPLRPLFLSFDPCHIIKNVRSQFLQRTFDDNGRTISSTHLKTLYRLQHRQVVKPVRFLSFKHLFPNNLEKMNVKRAVEVFSNSVTAGLETMAKIVPNATHDHNSLMATINFMKVFKRWFDIHNVSNKTYGHYSRNDALLVFFSATDERLDWLVNEFLPYIESLQSAAINKSKEGFTSETFHALQFTSRSTVDCIKYLLQSGFHYVLTDKLSSDDIERFFSNLRQMGGANDAMDSRSCLHAIETTLKTGIIYASVHGNTGSSQHGNMDHSSPVIHFSSPVAPRENCPFPPEVMEILKQEITNTHVTMRRATLALIAGFLVKIVQERHSCIECMISLSTPKRPAIHLQLIRSHDLGGLKYPSDDLLNTIDQAARFICSAVNYCARQGVKQHLMSILLPFFQEKLKCSCDNSNVIKIVTEKFINLMLNNIAGTLTSTKAPKGIDFRSKPLQRKILRL